jgi:hypothetical protein
MRHAEQVQALVALLAFNSPFTGRELFIFLPERTGGAT